MKKRYYYTKGFGGYSIRKRLLEQERSESGRTYIHLRWVDSKQEARQEVALLNKRAV